MLQIGEKVFLNIQEAVGWLLKNNALPFQSTANYVADTEIAKTTIINPSPAEIKVGALVLFADSKIGTVSGLTSNGFMVGSKYTDIKNALAYISAITVNASGYLICTLSDGTSYNAGQIKQISNFSINASQHLIATYNDGTTNDLGAIFQGNVNIAGNLTADSIIENMSGYSFNKVTIANYTLVYHYAGIVKNGNKLTCVLSFTITKHAGGANTIGIGAFVVPLAIANLLNNNSLGYLANFESSFYSDLTTYISIPTWIKKSGDNLGVNVYMSNAVVDQTYDGRIELTFLLSENLAA